MQGRKDEQGSARFNIVIASVSWDNAGMKRRYLIVAGSLLALACVVSAVLAMLPAPNDEVKAKLDRVRIGMTVEDVREIFGGGVRDVVSPNQMVMRYGTGDGPVATVLFTNSRVSEKQWDVPTETVSETIRRWLSLPW
jgi:hypothetical protein